MISTRNFANASHAKIGAGIVMQKATPNVGNLSSKWVPLKWDVLLLRRECDLIHKVSRSINVL